MPTEYPMCSQAWQLEVDDDGHWFGVLAWGVFTDRIVKHLGGEPRAPTTTTAALGVHNRTDGIGLTLPVSGGKWTPTHSSSSSS